MRTGQTRRIHQLKRRQGDLFRRVNFAQRFDERLGYSRHGALATVYRCRIGRYTCEPAKQSALTRSLVPDNSDLHSGRSMCAARPWSTAAASNGQATTAAWERSPAHWRRVGARRATVLPRRVAFCLVGVRRTAPHKTLRRRPGARRLLAAPVLVRLSGWRRARRTRAE